MTGGHGRSIFLYTDEDVSDRLAGLLRDRGYGAASAAEQGTRGLSDEAQLAFATSRGWTILTYNPEDFVTIVRRWHQVSREHAGIVVSQQFSRQETGELLHQVRNLLERVPAAEMWNTVRHLQGYR
jgi:hypothetical protein